MATVNKDFRVKHGLIVEGTTGTINGNNIVTDNDTTDVLGEGTTNLYYTDQRVRDVLTGSTQTNISITEVDGDLVITAEAGLDGVTTDDITEGTTNKYYSDTLVDNHLSGTHPIEYTAGAISLDIDATGGITNDEGGIRINRTTVDTWYDAAGAAASAQTAAESYADGLAVNYDPAGSASAAQTAAESYADGLAVNYDPAGSAATAQANAESYADGLASNYEVAGAVSTHAGLTSTHGVSGDIVGTSDSQTLTNKTMGDDLLMDGFQISGLGTPDQADHAATKAYVDAAVEGLHVHESVRVAVNGNISIATGLENGDTAGGVTLVTGNRVLLKDQTTASENGIYVVQASGQALRATDFDTAMEVDSGDFVFVSEGTYANTGWVQTLKPATIGTDPISFTQFSGAGTFLAGNGLILDGNTFEIDDTITANLSGVQTLTNKSIDGSDNTLSNIPNSALDNDSITINGELTALGGSVSLNSDDLAEGTTNLYFTDARAVTALEAVVPNFTAVEVNSLAKQVAATTSSLGSVVATAYSFAKASYRTAKFIVKIDNGTHNEVTEVLLSLDSSDNIAMTEYAIVATNGSRGTITADISGSDVRLRVDPVNDSTISVVGTLLV